MTDDITVTGIATIREKIKIGINGIKLSTENIATPAATKKKAKK